jgi:hypothetical protein
MQFLSVLLQITCTRIDFSIFWHFVYFEIQESPLSVFPKEFFSFDIKMASLSLYTTFQIKFDFYFFTNIQLAYIRSF